MSVLNQLSDKERFLLLGEVAALMLRSNLHRAYPVADIETVLIPPIDLNQYRIYRQQDKPVALVTWAYFSPEIEEKFMTGKYILTPDDWHSGDQLFFMDFIAPFGHTKEVIKDLRTHIFPDRVAKSLRFERVGELRTVYHWHGINVKSGSSEIATGSGN